MEKRFPNVKPVQGAWKAAGPAKLLPTGQYTVTEWTTVGTAFDYRLRYYFAASDPNTMVAANGASNLGRVLGATFVLPAWEELMLLLLELDGNQSPAGRRLELDAERELCKACYALALYEQCFRAVPTEAWPMVRLGTYATCDQILALATDEVVDDLVALSFAFGDQYLEWTSKPFTLNPTFSGSRALGGADADLIVDGCLLEIKTTKTETLGRPNAYQLVGYALADYDDDRGINSLGYYLSRHAKSFRFDLQDLLSEMAGRPCDKQTERAEFRRVLEQITRDGARST